MVPRTNVIYNSNQLNKKKVVKHPEWLITKQDYESYDTGISTTIPNLNYEDIHFDDYYI